MGNSLTFLTDSTMTPYGYVEANRTLLGYAFIASIYTLPPGANRNIIGLKIDVWDSLLN